MKKNAELLLTFPVTEILFKQVMIYARGNKELLLLSKSPDMGLRLSLDCSKTFFSMEFNICCAK